MIEFLALDDAEVVGEAQGTLRLVGSGLGLALSTGADTGGAGTGTLAVLGLAEGVLGFGSGETPELPVVAAGSVQVQGFGSGFVSEFIDGQATGSVALSGLAYGLLADGAPSADDTPGFAEGYLTLVGNAADLEVEATYGYALLESAPGVIGGYSGISFATVESDLGLNTQLSPQLAYVLNSILRLSDAASPLARFAVTVQSSLVYRDFATIVLSRELSDSLILTDLHTGQLRMIGLLVDQLMLADQTIGRYDALVTVISALLLADRSVIGLDGTINEALILNDTLDRDVRIIAEMVSNLELEDELEPILYLFATLEDTFALADQTTLTAALIAELFDTVSFGVRARVGDEVFIGYSMNTRLAAVSEYQNYPFNSLAMIGGRRYGAGATGVYRLEGDDDDGDPIAAHVRTGYLNFEALTHVLNAWIGYTSDGQLVLKVITADKGTKKENWYRMKARPGGGPVETRFDLAKGLLGTYWAFEIENLDGADFELDIVKIWPLRTQRRYSGR